MISRWLPWDGRFVRGAAKMCLVAVATLAPVFAEDDRDRTASHRLWATFLDTYRTTALEPKPAEQIDLIARQELIAAMGLKYRSMQAGDARDTPHLVDLLSQRSGQSHFALMEKALTGVMPKIDRFGTYESVAEMEQMEQAVLQSKGGVYAMQILIEPNGQIICYPDPDGPASKAGVLSGAVLLEVDGEPMRGKSLGHAKIAFAVGDRIKVKVLQPQGKEEVIEISRTKEVFPDASAQMLAGTLRLRIRNFNEGVAVVVRDALKQYPDCKRITIDLRGNQGGVMREALLISSLFLPKGAVISYDRVAGQKEGEEQPRIDDNGVLFSPQSIGILMDGGTASAAELLIASLKHHLPEKVRLSGEKSYGKSYRTMHMQLEGAGMVAISDGLLMGPDKKPWSSGIQPD